jgi:acetyl-CoA carboxylase beta subunit
VRDGKGPSTQARAWVRCGSREAFVYGKQLARGLEVCPECGHHGRLTAPLLDRAAAAEVGGTVARIRAGNGEPVEFGQVLVEFAPADAPGPVGN